MLRTRNVWARRFGFLLIALGLLDAEIGSVPAGAVIAACGVVIVLRFTHLRRHW